MTELFGREIVVVERQNWLIDPSVSPSVSQGALDEPLTNLQESGGGLAWAAILPALVAQVTVGQVREIRPLAQYGRVVVAAVIPEARVDPVLPLIRGGVPGNYLYWYRRYYRALTGYLGMIFPYTRRSVTRAKRRLLAQVQPLVTPREYAYFVTWLEHGTLGDYQFNAR